MTPLGCPDCLLIRYEPRAVRARFRARAHHRIRISWPSLRRSIFCYYTFFLELLLFFRMRDVCESQVFVVSRASNWWCSAMKSLMILWFCLNVSHPSSLRPFIIPHAAEQSQLSINSAFYNEFLNLYRTAGFHALLSGVILRLCAIIVVLKNSINY